MKNLQITEEAIKELHRVGGKKVKSQLVIQFPQVFPPTVSELIVGHWYKHEKGTLFCYQEGWGVYGFNPDGTWCGSSVKSWAWKSVDGLTPAKVDEVQNAFRVEAKRRGYTADSFLPLEKGVHSFNPNYDLWTVVFDPTRTVLYTQKQGQGGRAVFLDGVWAKQKDMKRIAQIKQEIEDLALELIQLDKYYI